MKSQYGFTLMELMIVVGIVGLLASIAIPAYQDYVARAQVTEALELASAARSEVTEYYVNSGAWPTVATVMQLSARYTSGVALTVGAGSSDPVATLTARVKTTGVQRGISGKAIDLVTQDGGATWECHSSEIAANLLPRSCRG